MEQREENGIEIKKKKRGGMAERLTRDYHSGQMTTTSPSRSLPVTCAPLSLGCNECVSLTQLFESVVFSSRATIYCHSRAPDYFSGTDRGHSCLSLYRQNSYFPPCVFLLLSFPIFIILFPPSLILLCSTMECKLRELCVVVVGSGKMWEGWGGCVREGGGGC